MREKRFFHLSIGNISECVVLARIIQITNNLLYNFVQKIPLKMLISVKASLAPFGHLEKYIRVLED